MSNEQQIELLKLECSKDLELFKGYYELQRINTKGTLDFALVAIRALILVNGAAVLALLTFLGNKTEASPASGSMLVCALWFFLGGVGFGLAITILAYLSQLSHTHDPASDGHRESVKGKWLRIAGIFLCVCSLISFIIGGIHVGGAFKGPA